jgi:AAA15 family ATPase/GTPase
MFDPDVRNLETLTPPGRGVAVMVDHARIGLAPVSVFGDGLRKALVIALILPRVADGVLLIDEIESSVHPSVLGRVFSWVVDACARLRVQLFVTTHSLEAVDAIVGASDNRLEEVVGFRLEADRMGSRSQRFSGELLQRLRQERGLDIR